MSVRFWLLARVVLPLAQFVGEDAGDHPLLCFLWLAVLAAWLVKAWWFGG